MSSLQLLSLHIPKTAGTSFYSTLEESYGFSKVSRFDIKPNIDQILLNHLPYTESVLPSTFEVLHGHFAIDKMYSLFPASQQYPMITWLRHPVERVLSNYFYLKERLQFFMKEHEQNRAILDKMMKTIEEFAATPINQNRMSSFTAAKPLEDFLFVGIQEFYQEDLTYLGQLLKRHLVAFEVNKTAKKESQIDPSIIQMIEHYNAADMALYAQALELRKQRKVLL